ncbi:intraflagellar transport protein 46 homolog isoform X2 [Patiria miniata]|uniref:Intraflagellar transport protein 46 homolog n=1 Tax=Patiria miniata TaxID=46514 RepID=A0A914AP75_PATMI|nr:intraflagellar transport protein 46 homolog isoform X1 [Patiria miniata]XP_038065244.1 intraflagellar transport protein 46 homolog isoform X2 [Patiria miniata]
MADDSDEESRGTKLVTNQPYDESLEIPDAEEVASQYTPSPRQPGTLPARGSSLHTGGIRGIASPGSMDDNSDDDFEQGPMETKDLDESYQIAQMISPAQPISQIPQQRQAPARQQVPSDDDDDEEDDDDDDEDGSDSSEEDEEEEEGRNMALEGAYDPAEYENLPVSSDIKELFQYITRYTPQTIELEHKLKPFIPDYIPAVGDIDAFIKIPRPDNQPDTLGLTVLDEPCAKQSDPTVLDLTLRAISKQTTTKAMQVRSIDEASKNPKLVQNWIESISNLHRSKPPPTVHYNKTMPDIESLMQEWPPEFEELLKRVGLPTADVACDLDQYVDMVCAILDIPVYQSRVQALHVLFTLYSEFKNSQHFKNLAEENKLDNKLKNRGGADDDGDDYGGASGAGGEDTDRLVF